MVRDPPRPRRDVSGATYSRSARIVGALLALTAAVGLALQVEMFVGQLGPLLGPWRWLGFFTVWANLLAVLVGAAVATGRGQRQRSMLVLVVALVGVGLVYSLLLRGLWNEEGVQQLVGIILHDLTPLLAAALWVMSPHGKLGLRDLAAAVMFPFVFLLSAELRGAIEGWYPYAFLDPASQGIGGLALSLGATMSVFALIAAALIAIDTRLARRD